jgi:DNA-binding PadR family transcriptional regulator
LPLSEATFFILLCLAPGELHGYALRREVARRSQNRLVLSTGTLYGALQRLAQAGWVLPAGAAPGPRARRPYTLTPLGQRALRAEAARLRWLASLAARDELTEKE